VALREINLSNNKLREISESAFDGLILLQIINLSNNTLNRWFNRRMFQNLPSIREIDLRENVYLAITEPHTFFNLSRNVNINI